MFEDNLVRARPLVINLTMRSLQPAKGEWPHLSLRGDITQTGKDMCIDRGRGKCEMEMNGTYHFCLFFPWSGHIGHGLVYVFLQFFWVVHAWWNSGESE